LFHSGTGRRHRRIVAVPELLSTDGGHHRSVKMGIGKKKQGIDAGVDVMITIFCDFVDKFLAKKLAF
jgi:hypothetical protein